MATTRYVTDGGIAVLRDQSDLDPDKVGLFVKERLKGEVGALFSSGYEYPGRYNRWEIGFVNPPVELQSMGRGFKFLARNAKGAVILDFIKEALAGHEHISKLHLSGRSLCGSLKPMPRFFTEEERSRQPSLFSILRSVMRAFASPEDGTLGFYGAFGYDLVFQFEPIRLRRERSGMLDARLYLPDEVMVVDRRMEKAFVLSYDFQKGDRSTSGASRKSAPSPSYHKTPRPGRGDHQGREYAGKVEKVREGCRKGDFFEVVLSQVFTAPYRGSAVAVFDRLRERNPSPYEFLINLGGEQLVGASPEMYVRVEGRKVETCPISGTVARGASPMEDADQIQELLSSPKEEAELTMCTDVDRNDKSRICVPGTVRVLGRRLIEVYSKVIHTVDHVEGTLREDRDGLDAFVSHMWACTLTGSPKPAAMQTIEDLENSPRGWYGGAIGAVKMNGDINTGITIRTVHLKRGQARIRVGATLLYASEPDCEQRETEMKASAFLRAVTDKSTRPPKPERPPREGLGRRVLFVDHHDSFVHTLASYVRATGATVLTLRSGFPREMIRSFRPDLVFLSPGPFTPAHFGLPQFILEIMKLKLPIFGVCLGMQGMVEAMGGELGILPVPRHGVRSRIIHDGKWIFKGLPSPMTASRYHSLYAMEERLPSCLEITCRSEDGVIMGVRHKSYPMAGVQFHPESIHSLREEAGMRLIRQVMRLLRRKP